MLVHPLFKGIIASLAASFVSRVWPDSLCLSAGVNLRPQVEPLPVCEETSNELRTRELAQLSRFFMRRPTRAALGPQSHITIYRLFVS